MSAKEVETQKIEYGEEILAVLDSLREDTEPALLLKYIASIVEMTQISLVRILHRLPGKGVGFIAKVVQTVPPDSAHVPS